MDPHRSSHPNLYGALDDPKVSCPQQLVPQKGGRSKSWVTPNDA